MTREVEYLAAKRRVRVLNCILANKRIQARQIAADLREPVDAIKADLRLLRSNGFVMSTKQGNKSGYVATTAGQEFCGTLIGVDTVQRGRVTPGVPGLIPGPGQRRDDCALYVDCLTKFCDQVRGDRDGHCRAECDAYQVRARDELVAAGMLFGRRVGNVEHGEKGDGDE